MIPEPWERHQHMNPAKRAFYEFHACMMEPWDGPASITFSDGYQIGAVLDRNGLRPSRYYVTEDDLVIMASEVGVIPDLDPLTVIKKGRLQPGRMFLVDMNEGRIVPDREIKERIYSKKPYQEYLDQYRVKEEDLPQPKQVATIEESQILEKTTRLRIHIRRPALYPGAQLQRAVCNRLPPWGTTHHWRYFPINPSISTSISNRSSLRSPIPALDCIREELVTATETFLGSEGNLLDPKPESCRLIRINNPLIDNKKLAQLREINLAGFKSATVDALFPVDSDGYGLDEAMDKLCRKVDLMIEAGVNLVIVSDRNIDKDNAAIPTLMAMGGLHHHLVKNGNRTKVSIILETGEAREVHHFRRADRLWRGCDQSLHGI